MSSSAGISSISRDRREVEYTDMTKLKKVPISLPPSQERCRSAFVSCILKTKYAPVMELVDMRDLGAVTSVENYRFISGARDL